MTTCRRTLAAGLAIAGGLAAMTACSSPSGAARTPSVAQTSGSPTSGSDGCGDAAERVARHLARAEADAVRVEGQCTSIVVGTTLADGDTDTATGICTAAAEVAYTGDVNAVTVLSRSGTELSTGISGANCQPSG